MHFTKILLSKTGTTHDVKFFAYDWRLDCAESAKELDKFLKPYKQVHIVAHSMGGIVSSKFMSLNGSCFNKVASFIAIATPFTGAVRAPYAFETGNLMDPVKNFFMHNHIKDLAGNYKSAYQLIPTKRYTDDYLAVVDSQTNEITSNFTYEQKIDIFSSMSWATGKLKFFKENQILHDSLLNNGTHIANEHSDKVYYIVGKGKPTIDRYLLVKDHVTEEIINSMVSYTEQGDDTVILQSSTNNYGSNRTFQVNETHMNMASNPETIGFVKKILNSILGGKPLSNKVFSSKMKKQRERKLSVMITLNDELEIRVGNGEMVFEEGGGLFTVHQGEQNYVGAVWTLGENRKQYALNPDNSYTFTFISNSQILGSKVDILDLENDTFRYKEQIALIGKLSPQIVTVSYDSVIKV